MFSTFLLGTVLVTSIVMLVLLMLPTNRTNRRRVRDAIPLIGAGALAVAILVASVAGLGING